MVQTVIELEMFCVSVLKTAMPRASRFTTSLELAPSNTAQSRFMFLPTFWFTGHPTVKWIYSGVKKLSETVYAAVDIYATAW